MNTNEIISYQAIQKPNTKRKESRKMKKECMFVNTCMNNLRKNLRDEMKRRRFTEVRMAIECNLTYDTLCNILRCKNHDIRLSTLSKIADGLGKPAETLLSYSEKKEKGGFWK